MVVLTIVGMVGLAGIIALISNSESAMPKPMHANINGDSMIILSASSDIIELPVDVINSKDGSPVVKASVVLSGLNIVALNISNINGTALLRFNKNDLELKAYEGYLRLEVRAGGFQEYINDYAVEAVGQN